MIHSGAIRLHKILNSKLSKMQTIYNTYIKYICWVVLLFLLCPSTIYSQANINKVEYFFDTDPGFGNGISIPVTANANITDQSYAVDISAITNGYHTLFIRSRDDSGRWSLTNFKQVFRASIGSSPNAQIVKAEYFFDADPGFGNATSITLSNSNNIADAVVAIDLTAISTGFHSFFIRTKDANGVWSLTNMQSIFKTGSNFTIPNLVKAEYFFDADPGFGNGIAIPFGTTVNLQDSIVSIDLSGVSNGFHSFNFRTQDQNGAWSLTNRATFFKLGSSTLANITRVEYFIDTDPGFGNATSIPVTQALNINNQTYNFVKPSDLTEGNHTLFVRAMDGNNTWSLTNNISFYHVVKKPGSGYCVSFNGTSQYASIPHNSNLNCNNQLTLEAWIYPTAYNSTYPTIIAKNNSGSSYELDLKNDGTIEFELYVGGGQRALNGGSVSLNKWTHIAAVYDGSQMKIYQNGTLVSSASYSGSIGTNTSPVTIGARSGGGALFAGNIDEIKIWNTALTQSQLRDRMCRKLNLNDALTANLMSYINCDEVNASSIYDLTDSLNHASLINSPAKVLSGAPIGDTSVYSYVTSGLPNKLLSANGQDSININFTSGTYAAEGGVHIYAVNNKPNNNGGLGGIALNNNRYFGVFAANISAPAYTANYYYSSNPFITGITPNELGLFKRTNNNITTWTNSNANLNTSNNSLEVTGQSTEYILSNCAVAVVPTATVSRTLPNVCDVTVANFSVSTTDGGSNPQYQWKLNGNNVGTNTNTYSHSALANGDSVWCLLTSNASCVNTPTVSSNKVITVYPTITTENINVFGCFTATYNSNTYNSSTSFIDTVRTYQGCDSIYKNVSITVYTNAVTYDTVRVSGCNSVLYNTVMYTSSTAFTDTVKTLAGCDNIYRRIIITVYNITPTIQNATVYGCGSAVFNSVTYTSSTLVKDTLKAASDCDSIYIHTQVTIINPVTQNVSLLGCGSYTYKSVTYFNSTSLVDTLHSISGCDSVYKNINITVIHPITLPYTLSGCNSVNYNSVTYTNSTTVNDTIKSSLGCDSIYNVVTINVTTVNPVTQTLNYSGCNSYVYKSITYTNNTTLHDTLRSYQGCDSVYRTINIIIHHQTVTTNTTNINGCNNVIYNSNNYSNSAVLRDTVRNIYGCDSVYNIVNINVTIVNPVTQTININGCDSAIFNTVKYTSSTVLHDTLKSYQGCDSVYRTINITVQPKPVINVSASVNPVCATNATILTASGGGNYTWSPSTALSSTSGTSVTASPANTITYTVTSNQICITTGQITVTTKPLPNVDAGANQSILLGSSTTLTATGAVSYIWNTGNAADTTASITVSPTSNTNYIVTGTGANGCTAQDLVSVAVNFSSLSVNTNNYNFGNAVVNTTATTNIVVTNNGTLAVTINGSSASSPFVSSISSQSLAAGASINIPASFNPTSTLFYTGNLTISTSIGNFVVSLQGRGVSPAPAWVITPTNRNFGNVRIGDSAVQTFALINTGNIPVNISSISSSGSVFKGIAGNSNIAVGGSTTISVKYKPTSIGTNSATITIHSSTNGLANTSAIVDGSGYIDNTPPTLNFISSSPYNGTKGVNPSVGLAGLYSYNIVYKSSTNTAPQAGYPKVGIDVNGDGDFIDADEGIFSMSQLNATTDWVSGEEYTFTANLAAGNTYSYQFFANDSLGNPAVAVNTNRTSGPIVTDQTLDLSIYANDISFSVAHPAVGQTFTVFATVHNNTPYSASNVNIRFYTDSVYYNETTIPFIGGNSTSTVSMNFTYNLDGFYPIKAWIDSAGTLGETLVLNNYAIRPVIVGNFTIPGAIVVNANTREQHCPDAMVVTGNAYYTGLNLSGNPPVLGAYVEVKENGNVIGTTYTITEGYFQVYIPHSCGSGNYTVEVTDYTLTGVTSVQSYSIACGVSCGGSSGGGGGGNYSPSYNGGVSGLPCCIVANSVFTNTYSFANNNTYKYTNDTVLVYADDTLTYMYTRDSISAGQTVSYTSSFNFNTGSHKIKYISYHHYSYQLATVDTTGGGASLVITTYTGTIIDSSIVNLYVDLPKPDLTLGYFAQTAAKSFTVKAINGTCINAGASKLYVYEANSNYDSSSIVLLDSVNTAAVAAGRCNDTRVNVNYTRNSWANGYHYLILKADGGNVIDELNENNNTIHVAIYVPQPEVYVESIAASNSDVHTGDNINFIATIKNSGSTASNFKVQFYVDNVPLGAKQTISTLNTNGSTILSSAIYTMPNHNCPLSIKVVADVDNDLIELNKANNKDSIPFGSDLVSGTSCYGLGSACNPYVIYVGSALTMSAPVRNTGLRDVDITGVRFNLSGAPIGTDNISHIATQTTANVSLTYTFNTVGNYAVEIEPDYNNDYCETDEANNLGYIYVTVTSAVPDLQVLSHFISPSNLNPNPGQNVSVATTVRNIGTLASLPSFVRFWVDNVQLGNDVPLNPIKVGRDTAVAATATYAGTTVGPKIFKVTVHYGEASGFEQTFTNNEATRSIIVGAAPDFAKTIKEGVKANRAKYRIGKQITLSNYIRNYGGDDGSAWLKFYYRDTFGVRTLIDSVAFSIHHHDSARVSKRWTVAGYGRIITEIANSNPQEFNVLNNTDSMDLVIDTTTPSVIITPNLNSVCEGASVTFIASSQNIISPVYVWRFNGILTGDTAPTLTRTIHAGDYASCYVYDEEQYLGVSSNVQPAVRLKTYSDTYVTICSSQLPFIWNGTSYSVANIYSKTLSNNVGCDSIATLYLTIKYPTASTTTDSIYSGNSYSFNGVAYTTSGTYTSHLTNAAGCDSTATLVLIVKPQPNVVPITGVFKSCTLGTTNRLYDTAYGGIWNSSNTNVATISSTGIVTSVANGTTTITYNYTVSGINYVSSVVYTVAAIPTPEAITGPNSVCKGNTVTLNCNTSGGVWSSLNNAATINQSGVLTGTYGGGTTPAAIRYTLSNNAGCSVYVTYSVTVNPLPAVPNIGYAAGTVNPQTGPGGAFCKGKIFNLVGTPSGGVFTSANSNVAVVTSGGNVNLIGTGSAGIIYTFTNSNGCSSSKTITGNVVICAGSRNTDPTVQMEPATFRLFPNPAHASVNIKVEALVGLGSIVITDLYGKQLITQGISLGTNTIDISKLSGGMYFVTLVTGERRNTIKLMVE